MAPMQWVVIKYGGTSVADPECWPRIAERVRQCQAENHGVVVVVSAVRGVTDAVARVHAQEQSPAAALAEIDRLHDAWLSGVGLDPIPPEFTALRTELERLLSAPQAPSGQARTLALGEMMSSRIGAALLNHLGLEVRWQDAGSLLDAAPVAAPSRRAYLSATCDPGPDHDLQRRLAADGPLHITQGFVASRAGETVVLGRGGSDTSAAYLAARLEAKRCEIWTDVPGMFSANPRQFPASRLLKRLGYREAQELASMGARVLHPRCIGPLREAGIPLRIGQTSRPEIEGTVISNEHVEAGAQVKAIVQRKGITLLSLEGLTMWHQVGFLAQAFAVFSEHGLSIDLISTSEASVTVSLDLAEHLLDEEQLNAVVGGLERICRVKVLHHCASVSLIGLGIRTILHRLGPAFEVFEQRRIHMVTQAANDLNLTFVVDQVDADKLVQQLHQQLIPGGVGGDSVFGPTWRQLTRRDGPVTPREPWWRQRRGELLDLMEVRDAAYVYSRGEVQRAARRLLGLHTVDRVLYSMKANAHPDLLRDLVAAGCGIECVAIEEIRWLLQQVSGLDPTRVLFTPNFASRAEYAEARSLGVRLTIDNLFVLEHWGADFAGQDVFLRLDPGSGLGHHKMVRTAGQNAKFGIPMSDVDRVVAWTGKFDIHVVGLHAHTGSGVMHPDAWQRTFQALAVFLDRFADVRVVDVGGGLGVPEKEDDLPFDLGLLESGLGEMKAQLARPVDLWIEPGRYLVAEAGVLLARLTQTKGKGDTRYAGLATGMNSLIRPALYGAYHEIYNLSRLDEPADTVYSVVGPICESADVLGLDRVLPASAEGDIILIANAGAYGAVMASHYNRRAPAQEIVID